MQTVASVNRTVVAALDRTSPAVVLAGSAFVGAMLGVVSRVWMRYITTHEEFSWPGTLFIVVGFGVAFAGQAGVYLARRNRTSRTTFLGLRFVALVTLLPLSFGAGAAGFPVIVLAPLALIRSGWNRWLRVLLGVLAGLTVVGVAVSFFADLDVVRATVGSVWFVAIYAVLVWAVCFSVAAQHDRRFTHAVPSQPADRR